MKMETLVLDNIAALITLFSGVFMQLPVFFVFFLYCWTLSCRNSSCLKPDFILSSFRSCIQTRMAPLERVKSLTLAVLCFSHHREDAEAPKAKLVKPNSLSSSRSGSSRSGASSTQSMVHNSAQRGPRPRPPAVAALKENGQPPGFPQSPPSYTSVVPPKTPEPPTTPKFNSRNMSGPTPPTLMVPAQTKAFQTV